jgi:glucose-1-phosphate adenylyltransferase
MRDTLGVLLAGGAGERLFPLTRDRAKPAVPFAGQYRIIDITLSNCINSDLRHVYILTQYKALSLNRHIREGWGPVVANELGEFIEILPPMQRVSKSWYQGTADAVYQNIYSIGSEQSNFVFILSGDHIYKMNYQKMLEQHVEAGADVTVATFEVSPEEAAGSFGVIETDKDWRIVGFEEKPAVPKQSRIHPDKVNASMGVYLFNTQLLVPVLIADAEDPRSNHDFGKDIIPRIIEKHRVFAYNFRDENKKEESYWRDVGTVEAYHEANMDLVSVSPVFNLYDKSWPLHTWQQQYPPAKFVFADPSRMGVALDSIVGSGSIVSGGRVTKSVLGLDVRVNSYSELDECIIFNHVIVGRSCRIRRAIIDRHVSLPEGTVIGYDTQADRARYSVTEHGVVVVVRPESMIEEPE